MVRVAYKGSPANGRPHPAFASANRTPKGASGIIGRVIDPIAFHLGPIAVHWYGIIIASAVLIAGLLGTPSSLPWAMTVSPDAAAAFPRCPGCNGPMHPSMLYEIGFHAGAFALIASRGTLLPVRGDTLKLYLLAYGIFRFGVEFVRGNEVQALGLTGPQLVLIPLTALLVLHFVRRLRSSAYRLPMPEPAQAPGG